MIPFDTLLGVKLDTAVAGLIGGIVSISFLPNLTPMKAALTIITGAASAGYLTPLVQAYFELEGHFENAFAFLIGFMGMNVLAGLFKLSERFRAKPESMIKGLEDDDG